MTAAVLLWPWILDFSISSVSRALSASVSWSCRWNAGDEAHQSQGFLRRGRRLDITSIDLLRFTASWMDWISPPSSLEPLGP